MTRQGAAPGADLGLNQQIQQPQGAARGQAITGLSPANFQQPTAISRGQAISGAGAGRGGLLAEPQFQQGGIDPRSVEGEGLGNLFDRVNAAAAQTGDGQAAAREAEIIAEADQFINDPNRQQGPTGNEPIETAGGQSFGPRGFTTQGNRFGGTTPQGTVGGGDVFGGQLQGNLDQAQAQGQGQFGGGGGRFGGVGAANQLDPRAFAEARQQAIGDLTGIFQRQFDPGQFGQFGSQLIQQALNPQGFSPEAISGQRRDIAELFAGSRENALQGLENRAAATGFGQSASALGGAADIRAQSAQDVGGAFNDLFFQSELARRQQQMAAQGQLGNLAGVQAGLQGQLGGAVGGLPLPVGGSGGGLGADSGNFLSGMSEAQRRIFVQSPAFQQLQARGQI